MSFEDKEYLKLGSKSIKGHVRAVSFEEGDFIIFYIPSLNLSSYGRTDEEAELMMKDSVLPDFGHALMTKPKALVFRELKKLGWERNRLFEKDLSKKAHIDKEGILREFELDEDTVISEKEFELV
ncbi:hypothetical protein ACFSQ3_12965 [Sphingobacterium corticis]|uniref:Uncharacterized protein n=1 Tax=Sphingobacterium corticis TaxID=1812823 RepID=A0ABW5NLG5_9SPHI